jgi:hypothetical protein
MKEVAPRRSVRLSARLHVTALFIIPQGLQQPVTPLSEAPGYLQ